jgi:hypothetical protein
MRTVFGFFLLAIVLCGIGEHENFLLAEDGAFWHFQ